MAIAALHNRLDQLADEVGRLRHCLDPNSLAGWRLERIADQVEAILWILEPTAAEIANTHAPRDEAAIAEAIRIVDQRQKRLHTQLGGTP